MIEKGDRSDDMTGMFKPTIIFSGHSISINNDSMSALSYLKIEGKLLFRTLLNRHILHLLLLNILRKGFEEKDK